MSKKVLVKSVTSLSEARYCSGMMVDYISFDFTPESENYIPKSDFNEIKGWLSGVKILASFETNDIFKVIDCLNYNSVDGFLFASSQINMLRDIDVAEKFLEVDNGLSFETNLGVKGIVYLGDADHLNNWVDSYDVLLGYDFENVNVVSEKISGYAFLGSKEIRPGVNNYDGLMEALEILEDRT
jgi:phosphoribosylanthranilate isomerase